MNVERRAFLVQAGSAVAALCASPDTARANSASGGAAAAESPHAMGVLVDLTQCIGCRLCEYACRKANGIDPGPVEAYDDQSVFRDKRRPAPDAFTVVNSWSPAPAYAGSVTSAPSPVYAKVNCLHCVHPACVSACIVGALKKDPGGAVTYDAWKCIGCRYCMVACPFQIPAYEYDDPLAPRVRKCEFCAPLTAEGKPPACVAECPRQAMQFGPRQELIRLAHHRIDEQPGRYVDHVYGEHEVGGTSWIYLSPTPFEQNGFVRLGREAPPALTETIQHGVFRYGLPPALLYGVLGGAMFLTRRQVLAGDRASRATGRADGVRSHGAAAAAVAAASLSHAATHGHGPRAIEEHDYHDEHPRPIDHTLRTPGVALLLAITLIGVGVAVYRFFAGLSATTNLTQQYPWGLWIGVDVASGVALAAGGFTTAFIGHVLHREHFHSILRPALLTAALGYTFVVLGLLADLGRYYNVWHPMFLWQGNSVLFEVGMCVMCYLNVLYLEFAPIVCERLMQMKHRPRVARWAAVVHAKLERIMFLLVIAGCVLSCLHQSSLGTLMVIAPSKLHPLWWSPLLPLLFLVSAIAVGFPMVIWESLVAGWSLRLEPETPVLERLARYVPFTLGVYLALKLFDVTRRGAWVYADEGSLESACWTAEVLLGVVLPILILLVPAARRSPRWLFAAASLVVLGVLFNRVNVFIIGYTPPFAAERYVPSLGEFALTLGLIACLMLVYRVCVTYLPVISAPPRKAGPA